MNRQPNYTTIAQGVLFFIQLALAVAAVVLIVQQISQ